MSLMIYGVAYAMPMLHHTPQEVHVKCKVWLFLDNNVFVI